MVEDVESWLLDSDPALRWQVERDVSHEPPAVWEATQAQGRDRGVRCSPSCPAGSRRSVGRRCLLSRGLRLRDADEEGQPWTATTWALNDLREWGLDPAVLRERRTAELLAENARWEYDDLPYWGGEVDCCINAWTVANGVWLGADITGIVGWFLEHRMSDGGWNCEWVEGSKRSSFHSTLNSLKGLLAYDATDRRYRSDAGRPAGRPGISPAAGAVPPAIDGPAGGVMGGSFRLPVPLGLQRAQRRRLLSSCFDFSTAQTRTRAWPRRWNSSVPRGSRTAPGFKPDGRPAGCGSKPM